ncbi:conjugal transfer protein TraI [Flavobacterium plurextorum]|uniref:Conjugal transfer protein TraI n=1 Tax=Flavobacterium plurextorum TaxID=1114867 RepID=A0ABX4CZ71_9FLAO|nr:MULTISPECIES: conjugal transfer protein TraI [Flavobacterium]OXB10173.1 conjugal transfer protein TraI [Flavobacterium plurextorum]WKL50430.1 conjugal transfer protein TraI [Flavobacterium pectinovorum]
MKTKKKIMICLLCFLLISTPARPATVAAIPILEIVKAVAKKVIKAIDLRIQKLQNKTIWLQNAQKKIENILSKLKLDEISDWTEKQKELYKNYYEELAKVKSIITYYQRIKDISEKQVRLVDEYERAWNLFQKDAHFNSSELDYMQSVYSGILDESLKNIDQIFLVLDSFTTQMSDAKRLEIINAAADQIDANYDDLTLFNRQNILLSLQRAKTEHDVKSVKQFYGIP